MAKINHNNSLDMIDESVTYAKNLGIMHLVTDINTMAQRKLLTTNGALINFGTCGYLGLELDQRLKDAACEYVQKFGTQFSVSRAFLTSGINLELEDYLSKMFDNSPIIVYSSTSTAHISIIPTLVSHEDAIILDQQVHMSVQTASQLLRQRGVPIEMIRHSNLEMLEKLILQMSATHKKIWYMIDGVYSMFGDVAPMDDLIRLMDKYEALHLYVDDAHGMGWYGKNGTGYVFDKAPKHPKIMLVNTLAKGFGVMGGLAVFPDEETCRKVRIFGGPLSYSHPLTPALIGSAIASAKIHLSPEITVMQEELRERIDYCNELLAETDLAVISNPMTPIYLLGMGQPKVAYNMIKHVLDEGFFVNPAMFPAVPVKNTGLRFTITRHVQKEDIKALVDAMAYHYPRVLEEEGRSLNDVHKAFKIAKENPVKTDEPVVSSELILEEVHTIKNIEKEEWNSLLGDNGSFDWNGLLSLEEAFKNNERPEENLDFYYYIVRDNKKEPVFATFFTSTILKDDMLALEAVSVQIEEKRKKDPYYLTSKSLTMGSMLTEGRHYFINRKHPDWKKAVLMILERVEKIKDSENINSLVLRDFDKNDLELRDLICNEGFVTVTMPNTNIVNNLTWNNEEEFQNSLSKWSRKNIRKDVFKYSDYFEVEYKTTLTEKEAEEYYNLYLNVAGKNRAFNMFNYPKDILKKLSKHPNWKFVVLKLKPEFDNRPERKAVAAVWCYVGNKNLAAMIIGFDYDFNAEYKVYKQAMYQVVKYARTLEKEKAFLGLSADFEKHKLGAEAYPIVAYIQTKDNFNLEVIESMAAVKVSG